MIQHECSNLSQQAGHRAVGGLYAARGILAGRGFDRLEQLRGQNVTGGHIDKLSA
jgi:hypothetical protein